MIRVICGAVVGSIAAVGLVDAAEVKVLSAGGVRAALTRILPEYERRSGHKIRAEFATPAVLKEKLLKNEPADVALVTTSIVGELEFAGKMTPSTKAEFSVSYIGLAVRAGAPTVDVSTPEAFRRTILAATSVAVSDPKAGTPLGAAIVRLAERLGFGEEMKSRAKYIMGPGTAVSAAVAKGEAEIGITLASEIVPVPGVSLGGELPADMAPPISTYMFVPAASSNAEAGKALLEFLKSDATAALRSHGLHPPKR